MAKTVAKKSVAALVIAVLGVQGVQIINSLPKPYADGCSGGMSAFYRNVLGQVPVWENCCDTHDKAYERGGTSDQRMVADGKLRECVAASGHVVEAWVMWVAVRAGGQPFFPFGWRWGYGRDYSASWWYERTRAE